MKRTGFWLRPRARQRAPQTAEHALTLDPELVVAWRAKSGVLRALDRPGAAGTAERTVAALEAIRRG